MTEVRYNIKLWNVISDWQYHPHKFDTPTKNLVSQKAWVELEFEYKGDNPGIPLRLTSCLQNRLPSLKNELIKIND